MSGVFVLGALGSSALAAPAINGTTGQFPFPRNYTNPYGIEATNYDNAAVSAAYDQWYADCVTSSGAGGYLRVQRPNDSGLALNSTVSEGIGYGMVIAVYMNDENLFDNLWKYEQLHLDGGGLMNWYINADGSLGSNPGGANGATDADEDMAWALLMASRQWGGSGTLGSTYATLATNQINLVYNKEVSGGIPVGGDQFGSINPSYFAPAYYREFASATGNTGWLTVASDCYTVLNGNLSQGYGNTANGLDSAWCTSAGVSQDTNNSPWDYQYDACRTPFRIVEDYLWFGNSSAQSYATKTSNFFSAIGAVSIVDGYQLNGTKDPQLPTLKVSQNPGFQSAAFVGPAGVGAMVGGTYQSYVNDTFTSLTGSNLKVGGTYYDESWTVMSLLMLSGNFLDYAVYVTPTPTATFPAYSPVTICVNTGGPQFVDSAGVTWLADKQFTTGSWGYDSTATGSTSTYANTISNTVNNQQTLYQTERWGNPTYRFTVNNGYYVLTLKFCENYDSDSHEGGRVFSLAANGTPVISGLDVYKSAGDVEHKAYDVAVTVVVNTGQLDLVFSSTADTSQVNAIEVRSVLPPGTPTLTPTFSPTATPSPTRSLTPTVTRTVSFTSTPTLTPSFTPSGTATATITRTASFTSTVVATDSATPSATASRTPTNSSTPTATASVTPTFTGTATPTPSMTQVLTATRTATSFSTSTFTGTPNMTMTPTATFSRTPTAMSTSTPTAMATSTWTSTGTFTSSATMTFTVTPTATSTTTATTSFTFTQTFSPTRTFSATETPVFTATSTFSFTPSFTATKTFTPTNTPVHTLTPSFTPSPSHTASATRTQSTTSTATFSPTTSLTPVLTGTPILSGSAPWLYPNPVVGFGPVTILLPGLKPDSAVEVEVFTTAFRKMYEESFPAGTVGSSISFLLDSSWANGLYYLVVITPKERTVLKMILLR